ncbi:MAG: hypothetical protein RSC75_13245 [Bacteroidales bacterium]
MKSTLYLSFFLWLAISVMARAHGITPEKPLQRVDSIWSSSIDNETITERTLFVYDAHGLNTQKLNYVFISDLTSYWIPNTKEVFEYDENGRKNLTEKYVWSTTFGIWTGEKKQQFFFHENTDVIDSVYYYSWVGSEWNTQPDRGVWSYNEEDNVFTEILYRWKQNIETSQMEWLGVEKREYIYDERNNLLQKVLMAWNSMRSEWRNSDKWQYTYDEHNNPVTWSVCLWRSTTNVWGTPQNYKTDYTYNEDGYKETELQYTQNYLGNWDKQKSYRYTYFQSKVVISKSIPYSCSFETEDEFNEYTVADANADDITWTYDSSQKAAKYGMNPQEAADDWLFTPAINLTNEKRYRIKIRAKNEYSIFEEKIRIKAGSLAGVEAMTFDVLEETSIMSSQYKTYSGTVIVPATGNYYFGIQACSKKDQYAIYIDDIEIIEDKDLSVPTMVEDLVVFAGEKGIEKVTVCFFYPSKRMSGMPLKNLTLVEIYKDNNTTPVKSFVNPLNGGMEIWEDLDVQRGLHSYSIIAYNDEGASDVAKASVFVGMDVPAGITNIQIEENGNKCILTWDAPTKGLYDGYIDLEQIKYKVYRNNTLIASDLKEPKIEDTYSDGVGQLLLEYMIVPSSEMGDGIAVQTPSFVAGTPYLLPYEESFAGYKVNNGPWILENLLYYGTWVLLSEGILPSTTPWDNDGGMISYGTGYLQEGATGRISTPKVDLSSTETPILSFGLYHVEGAATDADHLIVEISIDKHDFEPIADPIHVISSKEGWAEHIIDLSAYQQHQDVRLGFKGVAKGLNNIHLDKIRVASSVETTLEATSLSETTVVGKNGAIAVRCDATLSVSVWSVDGRLYYEASGKEYHDIVLEKGSYMVRIADKVTKVYVK